MLGKISIPMETPSCKKSSHSNRCRSYSRIAQCDKLYRVLVDALQNHTERCNGYLEAARKARSSCDWAQAEKLYLLAKEESQKSSDPMLLPQSLSDLAAMYYAKHQWTQAESNFQESLAAWQRAFDRQHNPTPEAVEARLATLVGFAHLLEEEKQFGRAEDLYKQAIKQDEGALSEAMMTRLRRDYIKLLKDKERVNSRMDWKLNSTQSTTACMIGKKSSK